MGGAGGLKKDSLANGVGSLVSDSWVAACILVGKYSLVTGANTGVRCLLVLVLKGFVG